jgi:hypothetical protein
MDGRRGPGRFKVKFTPAEDFRLMDIVGRCGANDWPAIAAQMPGRNARQCRERWTNYMNPVLVSAPWTAEEEDLLDEKFAEFGTRWQAIAIFFPTRSKNQIKNHWQSQQRRKVLTRTIARRERAEANITELPAKPVDFSTPTPTLWEALCPGPDEINWDDIFAPLF